MSNQPETTRGQIENLIKEAKKENEDHQKLAQYPDVIEQDTLNHETFDKLADLLEIMRNAKPDERSELARRYAVSITELEKVYAYFKAFVLSK